VIRPYIENSIVAEIASSQAARLAQISIAAQTALAEVPWNAIGEAVGVSALARLSLQHRFARFTDSYTRLSEELLRPSPNIIPLPSIVWDGPPHELSRGVDLFRAVSLPPTQRREQPLAIGHPANRLSPSEDTAFEALLSDLDPNFLTLFVGARMALRSTNPDRARHLSISLGELLTHVLQRLAPDNAVRAWTSNPDHYSDGRPTRQARLQYICRNINCEPFTSFIQADISAGLIFINLFQGGTHRVQSNLSDDQLHVMLVRMQGLLSTLLTIARSD
jgi:Predicted pPIWI-associating nuclease